MASETATSKADGKAETKAEAKADAKTEAKASDPAALSARAKSIINRNTLWALGAGSVPFPIADLVAVTAVQIKMIKELSDLYSVKFREELVKKSVGSLLSSVGGLGLGVAVAGSLAKLIPGAGTAIGIVTIPTFTAAFTHATGKVFMMHFESGRTLLDFDPNAMRTYFKEEFEKAKDKVAELKAEEQAKAGDKASGKAA